MIQYNNADGSILEVDELTQSVDLDLDVDPYVYTVTDFPLPVARANAQTKLDEHVKRTQERLKRVDLTIHPLLARQINDNTVMVRNGIDGAADVQTIRNTMQSVGDFFDEIGTLWTDKVAIAYDQAIITVMSDAAKWTLNIEAHELEFSLNERAINRIDASDLDSAKNQIKAVATWVRAMKAERAAKLEDAEADLSVWPALPLEVQELIDNG